MGEKKKISHATLLTPDNQDVAINKKVPRHDLFISPSSAAENDTDNQSFKKIVKRSLTTLKYDVENIHKRIDGLETLLEKIHDKLLGQSYNSSITIEDDILVVNNDTHLMILEDKWTNDSLYRSTVVRI